MSMQAQVGTLEVPTPPGVGVGYVSMIASAMGIASQLPEQEVARLSRLASKAAVNEALATFQATTPSLSPGVEAKIKAIKPGEVERELASKRYSYEGYMRSASASYEAAATYIRKATELTRAIANLTNKDTNLLPEVQAILKSWYTIDEERTLASTEGELFFITDPVHIRHVNIEAGINKTVAMGRYTILYLPSEGQLKVLPYSHNRVVGTYIHPHVSSSSHICWGDGASAASSALTQYKPSVAFGILRSLLQTYNDGSPYKQLELFERQRTQEELEALGYEYRAAITTNYLGPYNLYGWVWRKDMPEWYTRARMARLEKRKRTLPYDGHPTTKTMTQYLVGPLYNKYYNGSDTLVGDDKYIKLAEGEYPVVRASSTAWKRVVVATPLVEQDDEESGDE